MATSLTKSAISKAIPGRIYQAKGGVVQRDGSTLPSSAHGAKSGGSVSNDGFSSVLKMSPINPLALPHPPPLTVSSMNGGLKADAPSMRNVMKSIDQSTILKSNTDNLPESKRMKSVSAEKAGSISNDDSEERTNEAEEDEGDFQLFTRLEFERPAMPKRTDDPVWHLYSEYAGTQTTWEYVNTFEYMCKVDEDPTLLRTLRHLQHLMEKDKLDRYYILDEPENSWAIVVCGPKMAMWAGATSAMRAQLQSAGITFKLPSLPRSNSTNSIEGKRPFSPPPLSTSGTTSGPVNSSDRPQLLHFSDMLNVRALICSLPTLLKPNSKIRIISSQMFPNCTAKLNVPSILEKSNRSNQRTFTAVYEGIFSVTNETDIIEAFTRSNGTDNTQYRRKVLSITNEFNRAIKMIVPQTNSSKTSNNGNTRHAEESEAIKDMDKTQGGYLEE